MKRWECIAKRFDPQKKLVGVEVGVYKGKNAKQLLLLLPKLKLYMVDRWCEYSKSEKELNGHTRITTTEKKSWDKLYQKTLKKTKEFGDRAIVMRTNSENASIMFENRVFDFVFLDDDHSTIAVKRNIDNWMKKVKIGGYLCGHDYYRKTVKAAIDEIFPNAEIDDDKTWFVRVK